MYYLIYSSMADSDVDGNDIQDIISSSERNNRHNDITGILIYHDGKFIQMLEGKEEAVLETFDRIVKDERHSAVIKLFNGESPHRHFPHWKMALEIVDDETLRSIEAYQPLEDADQLLDDIEDDNVGLKMLRFFWTKKRT
jgi:hypothetical protein